MAGIGAAVVGNGVAVVDGSGRSSVVKVSKFCVRRKRYIYIDKESVNYVRDWSRDEGA